MRLRCDELVFPFGGFGWNDGSDLGWGIGREVVDLGGGMIGFCGIGRMRGGWIRPWLGLE